MKTSAPAALMCALSVVTSAGCANQQPPSGALPDQDPPRIEVIEPAPDSVVPGFDGSVHIRFDEPVRIPQAFATQLLVSPLEIYEVETGFSDLRIRPREGWRDSVVYCMEIPPGITDLLNNRTLVSTDFCFSTGIPISDTRITGTVLDAVTGVAQPDARVVFLASPDSIPYGAFTDREGRFSLRALPIGSYHAFAFLDRNRNFRVDRALEPHDSLRVTAIEGGRPDLLFRLVEPDSTPPRLVRAEAPDGLTVLLEFDDPLLRPQEGQPSVTVADSATGAEIAILGVRVGEPASVRFPGAPDDSAGVAQEPVAGPELPSRFVTVRLLAAIFSGTYKVRAEGFVNLRRLSGGGDTVFVVDVALPDSVAVRDSAGVVTPDTSVVSLDSLTAPPDTGGVRRLDGGAVEWENLR